MRLCKLFNPYYLFILSRSCYGIKAMDKITRSYYTPLMKEEEIRNTDSVIGLHATYNCVSWTRYEISTNKITHLNLQMLPIDIRKFDLNSIYFVVEQLIEKLPAADRYCMENFPKQIGGITGKVHLTLHSTRMQFISMMIALLNHRNKSDDDTSARVNLLKPRLCGRLFKILIGTEQVSTIDVVENILSNKDTYKCVPVSIDNEITNDYFHVRSSVERELLGQSLLLTLCFINVALYKNSDVIDQILAERKAKGRNVI